MPIYRYVCQCGKQTDEFRKIDNRHDPLECVCGGSMTMKLMAPMIQPDISGYMSVAVDKETGKQVYINSRRQHREFLRRNDYVEIGNDFGTTPPRRTEEKAPADEKVLSVDELKQMGYVEEAL